MKLKVALTIAGSDSSGGAGIQADIKTMAAHHVYAMSAITAMTAQNTTGVSAIVESPPEFLRAQIESCASDIFPDAVKTGMIPSSALIDAAADEIAKWRFKNVVVDPVMVATIGARLIDSGTVETLKKKLIPLARVITPNIPEAEILWGAKIDSEESMERAARTLHERYGCAVLCKGGHSESLLASDFLASDEGCAWIRGRKIDNPNSHGTGCTLSSAIASNLAKGMALREAVSRAKEYLEAALAAMLDMGEGSGPLDHSASLRSEFF